MRLPWRRRREARAESLDYAATIADAFEAAAAGTSPSRAANAVAAAEAAAGAWSRAFAVGMPTPATPAVTPAVLACIGRELILRGEIVFDIRMSGPGLALVPAANWDVEGRGPDPATWRYRVYMNSPSGTTVAMRPAAGVVHVVYSTDPARPWEGVSPIRRARLSAALVSGLETRLSEEAGASTGRVLPFPDTGADAGAANSPLATLRADLAALKGKTALVPSMATGWGEGRAGAPMADWKAHRIGADPPAALVTLRGDAERAILAACGLQPELAYGGGQAAALREAYRQFVHLSVAPVGKAVAAELALKLDTPGLAFDWSGLMAADVASKARAFQALTGGGMNAGAAAAAAGLEV